MDKKTDQRTDGDADQKTAGGDGGRVDQEKPERDVYKDTMVVSADEVARLAREGQPPPAADRGAAAPPSPTPETGGDEEPETRKLVVGETDSEEDTAQVPAIGADTLIAVTGLAKHYGSIRAVDGIELLVRRGDVLAFLGPNGAGKTTAMKMITGFLAPDEGRVAVCGLDVAKAPLEVRRRIGYLPENAPAYGEMTVRDFLAFVAEAREIEEVDAAIERVVGMTGLETVLPQAIETLSKGFKRRVGLAQALIHDPEVLILDEPTDGLDPNQKALVQDLISNLSSDKSIVVSTHILDEAERICNRALILSEGKILIDSTPGELLAQAPHHNEIHVRFEGYLPELVMGRVREHRWCESAAVHEDGLMVITPRDGKNHLTDVIKALEGVPVRDIRLQEGRLDDLFRVVTGGVAA